MAINVDDILTDAELDEWLGGQVESAATLRPVVWSSARPAREFALGEVLRIFARHKPPVTEDDILDASVLKRALMLGSAARLYELAMTSAPDPGLFYHFEKRYRSMFEDEARRAAGDILAGRLDRKGRSRRSVSVGRR